MIRQMLCGGDLRSIGNADAVAGMIAADAALFAETMALLADDDARVRMRAADALEKASRAHPELLTPHKAFLLGPASRQTQQEVRWHVLQMLSRLALTAAERETALQLGRDSLTHPSRIVAAEALSALFALGADDARERAQALLASPHAALRSRARRLLAGK